jgi:hypothetical protein
MWPPCTLQKNLKVRGKNPNSHICRKNFSEMGGPPSIVQGKKSLGEALPRRVEAERSYSVAHVVAPCLPR